MSIDSLIVYVTFILSASIMVSKIWDRFENWISTPRKNKYEIFDIRADILELKILYGMKHNYSTDEIKRLHEEYKKIPSRNNQKRNGYLSWKVRTYLDSNKVHYKEGEHDNENNRLYKKKS